jgi:hypothetical protein
MDSLLYALLSLVFYCSPVEQLEVLLYNQLDGCQISLFHPVYE